jgi:hypothetical protein
MAATGYYNTALKNSQLDSLAAELADGIIEIYSGSQAAVTAADPGVAACLKLTKNGGAWVQGSPTNGVNLGTASGGAITDDGNTYEGLGLVLATATWARFYSNDKSQWLQGTVGTSNAMITVTTTAITVGGPVALTGINIHF